MSQCEPIAVSEQKKAKDGVQLSYSSVDSSTLDGNIYTCVDMPLRWSDVCSQEVTSCLFCVWLHWVAPWDALEQEDGTDGQMDGWDLESRKAV